MAASLSLATVNATGDYTVDPSAVDAAGGAAAFSSLATQSGGVSNEQAIAALSAGAAALSSAAVLLAGSAAAGPVGLVFGSVLAATEALVALDPASGGPPGLTPAQAYAKGYSLEDFGVSPIWYDTPGPGGTKVGNGPVPAFPAGSFEAFADALLVADYKKNISREAWILHAQPYNFARWPVILAMAAASWNSTHSSAGSPKLGAFLEPLIGSGGTRSVCVSAVPAPSFGGHSMGVVPSSTTAVDTALWLAQYTRGDWASDGSSTFGGGPINAQLMIGDVGLGQLDVVPHLGVGKTICVRIANGPAQTAASLINRIVNMPTAAQAAWAQIKAGAILTAPGVSAPIKAAARPPAPAPSSTPWYAKKLAGNFTTGEAGIAAAAAGVLWKLLA